MRELEGRVPVCLVPEAFSLIYQREAETRRVAAHFPDAKRSDRIRASAPCACSAYCTVIEPAYFGSRSGADPPREEDFLIIETGAAVP
jgi:hypothetical protein